MRSVILMSLALFGAAHGVATAQPAALPEDQKAIFLGSPEDEPPEVLLATRKELHGRHYLSGDERNLHVFYPHIKGIGGGYMGVGSDQAYLFAHWMQADLVWLTDYDPWIKHLHMAYRAFFSEATTREAFLGLWEKQHKRKAVSLLKLVYADHPDRDDIVRVFQIARNKVDTRLRRLVRTLDKAKIPSFINDDEGYAWTRAMVKAGRVRPMVCNLIGQVCIKGVGEASKKLGVPIRVLYTSNAESYWPFKKVYRENILATNFDDKGVLLRTVASMRSNGDYRYNLHFGNNFKDWLAQPWVRRVRDIVPWSKIKEDEFPLTITKETPPPPPEDKKKKRRR